VNNNGLGQNTNVNPNPNINSGNIPNTSAAPQIPQSGQVVYDPYGNPVPVSGNQVPSNMQVQSPPQVQPQVVSTNYQQNQTVPQPAQQGQVPPSNNQPPEKKKPGKLRYILLVLFFISLLVLVWFLPDIRKFVTDRKIKEQEEIINGTLKCVYEEEDELITTLYTSEFVVNNNQLKSLVQTVETKGDTGSEEQLTKLNDECELLTSMVKKIPGVSSNCSLNSRKQMSRQEIDYSKVNRQKLTSAYSEAGGIIPDYDFNQDAREIKKEMTLARYSCTVN